MTNKHSHYPGFTLFELLIVIAIIAILATLVIVALDPLRQMREARNSARYSHVNSLSTALYRYVIEKSAFPPGLDATIRQLGSATTGCADSCIGASASCLDLQPALIDYLAILPVDPSIGSAFRTGYTIEKNPINNIITVSACGAEGDKKIFLMR
ncbi:MAG: prepilin-type N-terminal cleavage/methylation domain-containing protein [bacterium]